MFSRATTFDHNRLQLWPRSSTSYNYSSCLPFTMSATCWSQTSLLLSQSQHNHQQLRKRKWLPSGQIRICNTSYSNTRLSAPTPLPTHCNYTLCLFYIMILYWCTQFILSSVKLNRTSSVPSDVQVAKPTRGRNNWVFFGQETLTVWEKMQGVTHCVLREVLW